MDITQLSGQQFDEYELVEFIGQGGMSAVYRAHQPELERDVAIKLLSPLFAQEPGYAERFLREAKMAASLEHPHIVPIYDYGTSRLSNDESGDLMSFVVMRLLRGGSLWDFLNAGRKLSLGDTAALVNDLAKALDYAHRRGIIHRDVKPSNIMFDEHGTVYLVDFGIAKATQADMGLTAENVVLGTPPYISPEQWRGEAISPAVDQYALAAIAYEIITGKIPFDAPTPHSSMNRHLNEMPPPAHQMNPDIPSAVSRVLERALAKSPAERFASVGDFASAFREAITAVDNVQVVEQPATEPSLEAGVTMPSRPLGAPLTDTQQSTPPARVPHEAILDGIHGQQSPTAPPPPPYTAPHRVGSRTNDNFWRTAIIGGLIGGLVLAAIFCIGALALINSLRNDQNTPTDIPEVVLDATQSDVVPTSADITLVATDEIDPNVTSTGLPPINGATAPPTADLGTPIPAGTEVAAQPSPQPANVDAASFVSAQTLFSQPEQPVRDAAFSPDGQMLASAHGDGTVRLWREMNGQPVVLNGHTRIATAVDFSPDGSLVASSSEDGTIRLWDTATGSSRSILTGHTAAVRDIDFSPDGTRLASAGEDNTVRLWDVQTGALLQTMTSEYRWLSVAFSPDGSQIASGGANAQIALWDAATGVRTSSLSGHNEEVRSVAFSPDGRSLASGSTDDTVKVWDLTTGQAVNTFMHGRDVWVVTFSPDGRYVASGGRDNNLRIWDLTTGAEITNLTGHTGWVIGANFNAAGNELVTASGDGSVRLWQAVQ